MPMAEHPRRPRAHVRVALEPEAAGLSGLPAPHESLAPLGLRSQAPELVMVAPVEMWFGAARVGVKAGTKTYEQFRRYADILLGDLKD